MRGITIDVSRSTFAAQLYSNKFCHTKRILLRGLTWKSRIHRSLRWWLPKLTLVSNYCWHSSMEKASRRAVTRPTRSISCVEIISRECVHSDYPSQFCYRDGAWRAFQLKKLPRKLPPFWRATGSVYIRTFPRSRVGEVSNTDLATARPLYEKHIRLPLQWCEAKYFPKLGLV